MEDVSLHYLEVWVSVTELRFAMRNNMVLSHAVNGLGVFVRADLGPIQRKEKIQRVRVVLDVRNRIPAKRIFDYSPEVAVKLEFKVERAHGICKDCGYFGHGGGTCDKGSICGLPMVNVVSVVDCEAELLASRSMDGLLKEPVLQVDEAAPTGLEVGMSGNEEAVALVVTPPTFSAGNPSFKLGLTNGIGLGGFRGPLRIGPGDSGFKRKFGFGSESDGFGLSGDGPAGTDLMLKKPKSSFSGELVEVPVQFGRIPQKKSPKKRGRPRGSRNKKRTMNGDPEFSMAPSLEGANVETGLESEAEEE
uniref:uncharacterized protein LOC105351338 n=1 Tax=Fragaria vesca subsp. vesca TaxID=101020 RepID=UPI0005CA0FD8|nr:PREDICTED: uncharacterized protein LOC105351338 [Fragaria vesca subsp. vesca]